MTDLKDYNSPGCTCEKDHNSIEHIFSALILSQYQHPLVQAGIAPPPDYNKIPVDSLPELSTVLVQAAREVGWQGDDSDVEKHVVSLWESAGWSALDIDALELLEEEAFETALKAHDDSNYATAERLGKDLGDLLDLDGWKLVRQ